MKRQLVSDDKPVALVEGILPEYTKEGILIHDGHIVLIKKGSVHLRINFETVFQTTDSVTILYPGDTVMVTEWTNDAEVESLIFTEAVGRDTFTDLDNVRLRSIQHIRCIKSQVLVGITNAMTQIVAGAMGTLSLKDFHQIMLYQLRSFYTIFQGILIEKGIDIDTFRSRQDEQFAHFIRQLSENAEKTRLVNFYADKLNITQRHLCNIVQSQTGKSAKVTIDEYVVMRIRHYLLYSDKTISELAWLFNFATPSHFCEYFKRLTMETPQSYRIKRQDSIL